MVREGENRGPGGEKRGARPQINNHNGFLMHQQDSLLDRLLLELIGECFFFLLVV